MHLHSDNSETVNERNRAFRAAPVLYHTHDCACIHTSLGMAAMDDSAGTAAAPATGVTAAAAAATSRLYEAIAANRHTPHVSSCQRNAKLKQRMRRQRTLYET